MSKEIIEYDIPEVEVEVLERHRAWSQPLGKQPLGTSLDDYIAERVEKLKSKSNIMEMIKESEAELKQWRAINRADEVEGKIRREREKRAEYERGSFIDKFLWSFNDLVSRLKSIYWVK